MIYGYARVSTKGQARDGNSLEGQTSALQEAGAEIIYHDSYTGCSTHRPELDKLLSVLQPGDTLMVTKLDRFARSLYQGTQLIENLTEKEVTIHVLNLGVMNNTPTGKLIRNLMLGIAEFERDMIKERTSEGKAIAREKGIRVDGRPEKNIPLPLFRDFVKKQKDGEMTVAECCAVLNISRSTWYKKLKEV